MRILVAEDDRPVASFLRKGLEAEHYATDVASNGHEALEVLESANYDLLILDLVLPGIEGFEVLKRLREGQNSLPVLILTGKSRIEDRVKGLDLGADDYLVKPFAFRELSARVRALLRRNASQPGLVLQVADLRLDRVQHLVTRAEKQIELTPKEFTLLEYLMRNADRPLTRAMIIEHVWDLSFDSFTNVVDVYINYLRNKVDRGSAKKLIHTVRGLGYRLGVPE